MAEDGKQSAFDALVALAEPETRPLDLGGYAAQLKGQIVPVRVNAPGVIEAYNRGRGRTVKTDYDNAGQATHTETTYTPDPTGAEYERYRAAVCVLYNQPLAAVSKLDDNLLLWLFNQGWELYTAYHEELQKNSASGSEPISS
ncbi:MAG: hypothetical protein WCF84_02335 [Anaerolineae bacterium]